VGKPEGGGSLGRPRRRWVDNIGMDLVEVDRVMWSNSGQGQVESSCECDYEPSGSVKCWETIECPTRDLSSSAQLHGDILTRVYYEIVSECCSIYART
jgi:hypothetical protein